MSMKNNIFRKISPSKYFAGRVAQRRKWKKHKTKLFFDCECHQNSITHKKGAEIFLVWANIFFYIIAHRKGNFGTQKINISWWFWCIYIQINWKQHSLNIASQCDNFISSFSPSSLI
jgi:hypothetical protein